jgi:hypothetical protein
MMVAVSGSLDRPVILDRRRIEITDTSTRGTVQPYHTAQELGVVRGQAFIDECRRASGSLAELALQTTLQQIRGRTAGLAGCLRIERCAILTGSGRPSPTLEATLASHAAIHTAEGEFFREIVIHAAESCNLRLRRIREKELFEIAARELSRSAADLTSILNDLGKIIGPPWRQDHKFAALAAWLA